MIAATPDSTPVPAPRPAPVNRFIIGAHMDPEVQALLLAAAPLLGALVMGTADFEISVSPLGPIAPTRTPKTAEGGGE